MAAHDKGRGTVSFPIADMTVTLKEPLPGQVAALRRAGVLFSSEDQATQGQGGTLFLDVLDHLVTDSAILNRLYEGMATERITLEEYGDLALKVLRHFGGDIEEAPKNGPVATTRRRATARTAKR